MRLNGLPEHDHSGGGRGGPGINPERVDVGDSGLSIEEEGGEWVAKDEDGNTVLRYDSGAGSWVMDSLKTENAAVTDQYSTIKVAVVSDAHYNEAGGRSSEVVDASTWTSNLDTVMDDINDWGPDVVIQGGDWVDYGLSDSVTEQETWANTAVSYLEDGVDAPVLHSLGNHEHGYAGATGDPTYLYSAFGYDTFEDSYGAYSYDGFDVVILNTAYTTTDQDTSPDDHETPQEEVDWLRQYLRDNPARPKIVHMHVPTIKSTTVAYDATTNEETVTQLLKEDPSVQCVIYGHVHHKGPNDDTLESWDRIRDLVVPENTVGHFHVPGWIHVPTPHKTGTSTADSDLAWAKVELTQTGERTMGQVTAPYPSDGDTYSGYPTRWPIGNWDSDTGGRSRGAINMAQNPLFLDDERTETGLRVSDDGTTAYLEIDGSTFDELIIGQHGSGEKELRYDAANDRWDWGRDMRMLDNEITTIAGGHLSPQSSQPSTFWGMVAVADGANWDPAGTGNAALVARNQTSNTWEVVHEFTDSA